MIFRALRHRPGLSSAALLFTALLLLAGCTRESPMQEPIRAVRTLTIANASSGGSLEYAAEVRPRVESRLAFRVGGKVVKRSAELGMPVKAGQVLAELDPQDLRLGQDSAQAALASAQASYDLTDADLKRYRNLKDQGFISAAELERREAALKSALSQLNQARTQLSVQGNQATYARLVADVSGVVTSVDVEPGAVVSAGTAVVRVAQDGPRDVLFSVPEDKLPLLRSLIDKAGAIRVKTWGDASLTIPARVREVSAAADPATRTFLIKADVGRAAVTLGQTATVSLELPETQGITRLPLSAVTDSRGATSVWVLDAQAMSVKLQPIVIGGASGDTVIVASGLAPGQEVVTAGVHVLTPGQKVKRYVEPMSTSAASPTGRAAPAASSPGSANVR